MAAAPMRKDKKKLRLPIEPEEIEVSDADEEEQRAIFASLEKTNREPVSAELTSDAEQDVRAYVEENFGESDKFKFYKKYAVLDLSSWANDLHLDVRYLAPKPANDHPVRRIVANVLHNAVPSVCAGAHDPRHQLGVPGELRYEYWVFNGKFDPNKLFKHVEATLRDMRLVIEARVAKKYGPKTEKDGFRYQFMLHVSWMCQNPQQHTYTVGVIRF